MSTYHAIEQPGSCRTLGCIAGVAIDLFPDEAERIAREHRADVWVPPSTDRIAETLLGLDQRQA